MAKTRQQFKTTAEYIKIFPKDVRPILQKVRQTIRKTAPKAVEKISYGIPSFHLNGRYLIYFAGYKNHIGLYPIHFGTSPFKKELVPYKRGKATVRFPLEKPIPYNLIKRIVIFRMKEIKEKS